MNVEDAGHSNSLPMPAADNFLLVPPLGGAATLNVYANTPHDTPLTAEPLTPTELDKKLHER